MTAQVANLWRHPIKGIGAKALQTVALSPNRPLPGDRAWAVQHAGAPTDATGWRPCREFLRGASSATLMAITAQTAVDGAIALRHPDRPDLTVRPDADAQALLDWLQPLWPRERPAPTRLVKAPETGMTDVAFPSVAILNTTSLRALGQRLGQELDQRRFRGNIWLDGLAPWEEFDLVGQEITIGTARLKIEERITRCRATEANPDTGQRDAATLQMLQEGWGHQDFGVYARVVAGGDVAVGDTAEVA